MVKFKSFSFNHTISVWAPLPCCTQMAIYRCNDRIIPIEMYENISSTGILHMICVQLVNLTECDRKKNHLSVGSLIVNLFRLTDEIQNGIRKSIQTISGSLLRLDFVQSNGRLSMQTPKQSTDLRHRISANAIWFALVKCAIVNSKFNRSPSIYLFIA